MTNITILGSGFGALTTVRELRKRGVGATITVISPKKELHYLPSSIWIPAKLRKASGLKIPLGAFFAKHKVDYVEASVTGLKDKGRTVVTDKGEFANDQLVIATGGRFLKKLPGIENALTICEGLDIGEEIDRRLSAMDSGTLAFGFSTNPERTGRRPWRPDVRTAVHHRRLSEKDRPPRQVQAGLLSRPRPSPASALAKRQSTGFLPT